MIVHFDTGAEGDYLAHVTFFARVSAYFIPRESNNHIKVMILRLEWYK